MMRNGTVHRALTRRVGFVVSVALPVRSGGPLDSSEAAGSLVGGVLSLSNRHRRGPSKQRNHLRSRSAGRNTISYLRRVSTVRQRWVEDSRLHDAVGRSGPIFLRRRIRVSNLVDSAPAITNRAAIWTVFCLLRLCSSLRCRSRGRHTVELTTQYPANLLPQSFPIRDSSRGRHAYEKDKPFVVASFRLSLIHI